MPGFLSVLSTCHAWSCQRAISLLITLCQMLLLLLYVQLYHPHYLHLISVMLFSRKAALNFLTTSKTFLICPFSYMCLLFMTLFIVSKFHLFFSSVWLLSVSPWYFFFSFFFLHDIVSCIRIRILSLFPPFRKLCCSLSEPGKDYAKWKKPVTETTFCMILFIWNV